VLRGSQRDGYRCLFERQQSELSAMTVRATKSLKDGRRGSWSAALRGAAIPAVYHPHNHYVVPGGGVLKWMKRPRGIVAGAPKNFLISLRHVNEKPTKRTSDETYAKPGCTAKSTVAVGKRRFSWSIIRPVGHGVPTLK